MRATPVAVHPLVRRSTQPPSTLPAYEPGRQSHFLRMLARYGPRFGADTWYWCPPTQSPPSGSLERFWRFFRRKQLARRALARLLAQRHPDPAAVTEVELPEYLMLLELLLIGGEYAQCLADAETLNARFSADLRLQDIRARAMLLGEDDSPLTTDLEYGWKPFARHFCPSTFDTLAFFERDVYTCCCNFLPTPVGSVRAASHEELWDGAIAQDIRGAILDGSYRYCNKMVCPRLRNRDLPLRTEPTLSSYYKNIIANGITASPGCHPRTIELNEDPSCNLACPSCRVGPVKRDTDVLRDFERNVLPGVLERELNSFLVACYGEPFASSHYLRVLRGLDPARHRIKELVLYTNGVLFTPAQWDTLSNLHAYPTEVRISIDAATAATYARVRPTIGGPGDFRALLSNLEFVSGLRRAGRIRKLKLMFVVQDSNFEEMPAFVQMAKWLGADEVVFVEMQKFGRYFADDALYAQNAVHLAGHPNNEAYRAVLADPVLTDPIVSLHGCRLDPQPKEGPMSFVWRGDALARTMVESVPIPADGQFHLVMALGLNKHATRSNWFYTSQITFQQGRQGPYGAQFMMLVRRDADGESIMSPMKTGQVVHIPNAYCNATLSDTVQDAKTLIQPPAGDYTFELYALSGGGNLLVIGTMTTISVLEIPQADGPPGGR